MFQLVEIPALVEEDLIDELHDIFDFFQTEAVSPAEQHVWFVKYSGQLNGPAAASDTSTVSAECVQSKCGGSIEHRAQWVT
eukprot:CAMPEP_0168505148 /NCGR_PEP_ID=MMETSP0228-20121227/76725_1 /TAXON_ID=133427 /ORGANISM="Protoceratium reticulatum, Strain CCCM 535 (=CCMP 1889)" /LENGTH=80 /DNA_ID=CAMNT_0008522233 /DNA_START=281 /DNA_END=520 /DNA_ORIENTATION=+